MKWLLFCSMIFLFSYSALADDNCQNYWSAISPDGNYIYFSSDRHGGEYEIYRVDIDGYSNLIRLTNLPGANKLYPSISPDGSLITFQYGDYGAAAEVYIMNNDGSNLTQLTDNNTYDGYPNFSPDGSKIVFDAWDDSPYPEVFTMSTDGSNRTQLTNESGAFWQSAPIYNPAGTKIYFSQGFNADNHYVMMDLDGTNWVDITPPNEFGYAEWALQFNADGSKIIFYTTDWLGYNNGTDIVIADADGANWNKITNAIGGEYYYVSFFHPTNGMIYFSYWPGGSGKWSINTMGQDGSNINKISNCYGVGIDEDITTNISYLFPNPLTDYLNVDYDKEFTIEIYDMYGRLVIRDINKNIEVSTLNAGVYNIIMRDIDNKVIKIKKVIKL